ncbi:MAG: hypothetical protein LBL66_08380 [Clostridiales bacterium]|jgi:hypothetical protein|nr:hypothetical protein [Clostridiales bacterium]
MDKQYPKYSMKERYKYHAEHAKFVPKGEPMNQREKNAYSLGYVKHARQEADIYN